MVRIEVAAESHVGAMADLLAASHSDVEGTLAPHALADPAVAVEAATAAMRSGPGVVAIDRSAVVGYMIVPLPGRPGTTTARLGVSHHASQRADARAIYRRLYEAVSERVVPLGCTYHSIPVLTERHEVVTTFFELEFGINQIDGVLELHDAAEHEPVDGAVRFATEADVDRVVELSIELSKYHSRPPMFHPALQDFPTIRRGVELGLKDDRSAVVVAEVEGAVVGMAQAGPDSAYRDTFDIGMNIVTSEARQSGLGSAMLEFLLAWGSQRTYRQCTVGWTSSNLASDAFYRSRGFRPIRYRLHRRIDTRASWANENLDYSAFQR